MLHTLMRVLPGCGQETSAIPWLTEQETLFAVTNIRENRGRTVTAKCPDDTAVAAKKKAISVGLNK